MLSFPLRFPPPHARLILLASGAVRDLEKAAQILQRAAAAASAAAAVTYAMERGRPEEAGDPGVAATNIAAALSDVDRAVGALRSNQRILERESTRRVEATRVQRR